jgi:hypothetical protein
MCFEVTDEQTTKPRSARRGRPLPQERRRREVMLVRLMLLAADIVLSGEPLGLETARYLSRELRHCYPELVDESL